MRVLKPATLARVLLLGTVLVWGGSFVVVKAALGDASPLLFNLIRMSLAAVVLAGVNWRELHGVTRAQVRAGALAGLFLALGYQFQTFGLVRTTAAKSAFITGLVVVFVPLLTLVPRFRPAGMRAPGWTAGVGACLAFGGLLLVTTPAGTAAKDIFGTIGLGDLLTLVCALAFAGHLLILARVSKGMGAGLLGTLQIADAAGVMLVTLPLEPVHFFHLTGRLVVALGVTSVLATAAAFTIQSYAQQHLPATQTAVILTLEPVFAWLTSMVVLGERLSGRSMAGAGLILISIALIELLPGTIHSTEIPG
ncbi:DMT family transporter [Granulicella tundricola]|uniref:EamA domain-containing protein n=1 Tax=Granulicella tundricola (strain ATCC BAA-1859 / DSM 23138 / MP5ACTX9) TaxID=1198114 RepID=E8WX31_GRATM|nr:DMT family transporter [Granulicella tundricola]ADW68592.1 protein of unknown function DUF6 transmembrane [Granulicella tundricola MP5ACTX9]